MMAKLIMNPTSAARRDVPLPRTLLSIGRDPSNDLVLPDAMVSRRHAVIECRGSQYFLRDCNSSNGSLVNGDRVSERGLRDGDLVAIGTVRLLFREEVDLHDSGGKVIQHPSAPRLVCPQCNADYRKGDLFCRQCGARLEEPPPRSVCTSCGTAVLLPARFCNACGQSLSDLDAPAGIEPTRPRLREGSAAVPVDGPTADLLPVPPAGPAGPDEAAQPAPAPASPAEPSPQPKREARTGRVEEIDRTAQAAALAGPPPAVSAMAGGRMAMPAPAVPLPGRETSRAAVAPALQPEYERDLPLPPYDAPPVDAFKRTVRAADLRGVPPLHRLAAALIDCAIVGLGQAMLIVPAALYWRSTAMAAAAGSPPSFLPILVSVSLGAGAALLFALYHAWFWGVRGATPGKQLLGLAVEGVDGRTPIGMPRALLRVLGYVLSAGALGLGFAVILFGATSLHDRLAGTSVVRRAAP